MKDPVKYCKLYRKSGCSLVDGMLCDFDKCRMRLEHELSELEQQLDIPMHMRYHKLNQDHVDLAKEASKSLPHKVYVDPNLKKLNILKLSDLRKSIDFWFTGHVFLNRPESEAMVRDILHGAGVKVEDDIVMCSKCMYQGEPNSNTACQLDDPNDGSAACFRHDHFEPKLQ